MTTIEDLLHRRTDLSTFLVHLTRDGSQGTARENLLAMAENRFIEARTPFGSAARYEPLLVGTVSQKSVCFTETPLEHAWMMLENISGRAVQFKPYGFAITKATARKTGCNPVWYTDITVRGRIWPAKVINTMIENAVQRATSVDGTIDTHALASDPIFRITPYSSKWARQGTAAARNFGGNANGAMSGVTGLPSRGSLPSWHLTQTTTVFFPSWSASMRRGASDRSSIPGGAWSGRSPRLRA